MDNAPHTRQNPNVCAAPQSISRGEKIARILLTVLLSLLCILSTVVACTVFSVRTSLTPLQIYNSAAMLDPAGICVAMNEDDSPFTLGEAVAAGFDSIGVALTEEDITDILDRCGIPTLLTAMAQDACRHFLGSGSLPLSTWTAEEVADYIVGAMDEGMYQFLSYLGDPYELSTYLFARAIVLIPVEGLYALYAPYRVFASEPVLVCAFSCAVISFCFLVLLGMLRAAFRFLTLFDCVLFLLLTDLTGRLPNPAAEELRYPFLEELFRAVTGQIRVCFLTCATVSLVLFILSLLFYIRTRRFRAKAQEI